VLCVQKLGEFTSLLHGSVENVHVLSLLAGVLIDNVHVIPLLVGDDVELLPLLVGFVSMFHAVFTQRLLCTYIVEWSTE